MLEDDLIRKLRKIPKLITSSIRKLIVIIHIMLSISRSKCNQIMKFGQFADHNMRNIWDTSSRFFPNN